MYWILDLDNEVHSIRVIWYSGLQESKNQARVMVSQGHGPGSSKPRSGFFDVAHVHCPDAYNIRGGYLERPHLHTRIPSLQVCGWYLVPFSCSQDSTN